MYKTIYGNYPLAFIFKLFTEVYTGLKVGEGKQKWFTHLPQTSTFQSHTIKTFTAWLGVVICALTRPM